MADTFARLGQKANAHREQAEGQRLRGTNERWCKSFIQVTPGLCGTNPSAGGIYPGSTGPIRTAGAQSVRATLRVSVLTKCRESGIRNAAQRRGGALRERGLKHIVVA